MTPNKQDMGDHDLSPVYERNEWVRPQVSQSSSPWTVVLGVAGAGLLGLMVFTSLSSARGAHASTVATTPEAAGPPAWHPALQALMAQQTAAPPPTVQAPI